MALGIINPIPELLVQPGLSSSYTGEHVLPQDERGLMHPEAFDFGSFVGVNSDPQRQSYGGFRGFSFVDDFYFRIYLLPNAIDFGAVVITISRPVTVWNAYFETHTLESVVPVDGSQVTFVGDAVPFDIPALTLHTWQFTVGPDGPPSISDTFTFTFDTGEVFDEQIKGTRSVLWPFLPNWRDQYTITREFNTDIFQARDGSEQRTAQRTSSRKTHEFTISALDAATLRRYRQLMVYWQDRPFLVSDVTRTTKTALPMSAGDTSIQIEPDVSWLTEDVAVILTNSSLGQIGIRIVDGVDSAGLLTFKDTDAFDWPAGTVIACGIIANLVGDRQGNRVLNTAEEVPMKFMQLPGSEVEVIREPTSFFNGRELFLGRPDWGVQIDAVDMHQTELVDYGIGVLESFSPIAFSSQIWSGSYLGKDSDSIEELLHLFERMKGRQGEFYMPTWEYDIPLAEELIMGTTGLRTRGLEFLKVYGDDPMSRALLVILTDGTYYFRAIDDIVEINDADGDDTLFQLTETWPVTHSVADVDRVCWVKVWRFATDSLTAAFLTNSVANLQMSMQSLPDLPAEVEDSNT